MSCVTHRHPHTRYGWMPDRPDIRDHVYAAPHAAAPLPAKVDLRAHCPAVYDQGDLGSCTGNAIAAAVEFDRMKRREAPAFTPSRLFIYFNERVIEHTVPFDSGAQIRDGIKSIAASGVCPEANWPYDVAKFADRPPAKAYVDALFHKAVSYERLRQVEEQLRGCLASGYPFVFGFTVYESFESAEVARTGVVPMPQPYEAPIGGHAVMAVGYDDSDNRFIVRNSWGADWGMAGYFTIPYAYVTNPDLADDLWTVRTIAH